MNERFAGLRPGMRRMIVPDHSGHSVFDWHPGVAEEEQPARDAFNLFVTHGCYIGVRHPDGGGGSELVTQFDPNANMTLGAPVQVG